MQVLQAIFSSLRQIFHCRFRRDIFIVALKHIRTEIENPFPYVKIYSSIYRDMGTILSHTTESESNKTPIVWVSLWKLQYRKE